MKQTWQKELAHASACGCAGRRTGDVDGHGSNNPDDATASSHDSRRAHPARRLTRAEAVSTGSKIFSLEELPMTEATNPIVQAVHDAIEAAIAATATEFS